MNEWITFAGVVVSGLVTLAVCLLNNKAQMRKQDIEQDKRMVENSHQQEMALTQMQASIQQNLAIITTTIENLAQEVREHNNFARRMPVVEEKITALEQRLNKLESN